MSPTEEIGMNIAQQFEDHLVAERAAKDAARKVWHDTLAFSLGQNFPGTAFSAPQDIESGAGHKLDHAFLFEVRGKKFAMYRSRPHEGDHMEVSVLGQRGTLGKWHHLTTLTTVCDWGAGQALSSDENMRCLNEAIRDYLHLN